MRKIWSLKKKIEKKSFGFGKKKWLRYLYGNWTLISVPDTKTWFRLHNTAAVATKACLIKPCCGLFLTTMLNSGRKNHLSYKMLLGFPNLNCSTKFSVSCSIHFPGVISGVLPCRYTAVLMRKNCSFEKHVFFWSIQKGLYVLFSNMFAHQRVLLTNNAKMSTLFSLVQYTYSLHCAHFGSWKKLCYANFELLGLF